MSVRVQPAESVSALPRATPRLDYIDGLRGFAVLLVLAYHSWLFADCPWANRWNVLASGYIGVNLFLVLSGFCLYWPFVTKASVSRELTLREFALRRAHRILPPYYIALGAFVISALCYHAFGRTWPDGPQGSAGQVLQSALWHAAMLHNLRPEHMMEIAGPFWSLALEVSLYVAMPILVVLAQRFGIGPAVGFAALVTLTYRIWLNWYVGGSILWQDDGHTGAGTLIDFLPGRWLEFALGMGAASLVARTVPNRTSVPFGWASVACLAGAFLLGQKFGQFNVISDPLYGLGFFFLILQASRQTESARHNIVGALLRHRSVVGLGTISYSVYLIHQPLLRIAVLLSHHLVKHNSLQFVVNAVVLVPLIVLAATVFFRFCEKPFINTRKKKPSVVSLQSAPASQEPLVV